MPRPKPPEKLFPVTIRLTRNQIRKKQEMGGNPWLRELISSVKWKDPIAHTRAKIARNKAIAASTLANAAVAEEVKLSVQRVRQIKREHKNA